MTNLQEGAPRLSGTQLRRLWLWAPIATGALLAAAVAAALMLPLWNALQRDTRRLNDLQGFRNDVSLLRSQLSAIDAEEERVRNQNGRLSNLITGRGGRSTFLAKLDQVARSSGVQLDLYEPQAGQKPPAGGAAARPRAGGVKLPGRQASGGSEPSLPVEVPGLERHDILVSARGSYPSLLEFLRRLESLNVLVAHSDLSLSLEKAKGSAPAKPLPVPVKPAAPKVLLKMLLSLYTKPMAAEPGSSGAEPAEAEPSEAGQAPAAPG